ncbi:MAG: magnesium transporter [Patescibacteria group bacterium]
MKELSKKTQFYIKEYGPHSHVSYKIVKESMKILIFASIMSSLGGLFIEKIKVLIFSVIPMIILLPYLNNMIGNFGTIIATKFSTYLHEGKIDKKWWRSQALIRLFIQILIIALFMSTVSALVALLITSAKYPMESDFAYKIFAIAILDVLILVNIMFFTSIIAGFHFYKKNEDPNNFLIPITTSISDFGNMLVLSLLVIYFFK